jgi:hypothetical protein
MRGMTRSLMMMDGPERRDTLERFFSVAGRIGAKPQVRTSSVKPSRVLGSSSTINTRSPEVVGVMFKPREPQSRGAASGYT